MDKVCYYCDSYFQTVEQLMDHLEIHSTTIEKQKRNKGSKTNTKRKTNVGKEKNAN